MPTPPEQKTSVTDVRPPEAAAGDFSTKPSTKDSPHDLHQQADNLGKKDGAMKSGEGSRSDASGQEAELATARPEKSPPPDSSSTSEQQKAHAATHASFRRYSKEYETLIQEAQAQPKGRNLYYKEQNGVAAKMSTGIMNKLHLQAPASYGETLLTDENLDAMPISTNTSLQKVYLLGYLLTLVTVIFVLRKIIARRAESPSNPAKPSVGSSRNSHGLDVEGGAPRVEGGSSSWQTSGTEMSGGGPWGAKAE